jgi:hypothetical protein
MGNLASSTSVNDSQEVDKQNMSSDIQSGNETIKKHRLTDNNLKRDIILRDEYLRKLSQNKKENEEKYLIRNKTFLEQFPDFENISHSSISNEIGKKN